MDIQQLYRCPTQVNPAAFITLVDSPSLSYTRLSMQIIVQRYSLEKVLQQILLREGGQLLNAGLLLWSEYFFYH